MSHRPLLYAALSASAVALLLAGLAGASRLGAGFWYAAVAVSFAGVLGLMGAKFEARLRDAAVTDPLTSLYNRRHLWNRLEEEIERSRRQGDPFSILFIDVDHLKRFNDGFGHAAGDVVLCTVAEALRNTARRSDVYGRWGGDEFVVIAPATTAADAHRLARRIQRAVAIRSAKLASRGWPSPTVSLGCADADSAGSLSAEHLLGSADRALRRAKGSRAPFVITATARRTA